MTREKARRLDITFPEFKKILRLNAYLTHPHLLSKNCIWVLVLFSFPRTQTDLSSPDQGRFFGLDDSERAVMSAIDAVEGGENPISTHTHATMNLLKWEKKSQLWLRMWKEKDRGKPEEQQKKATTQEYKLTKATA